VKEEMPHSDGILRRALTSVVLVASALVAPTAQAQTSGTSQDAIWNCTGNPCPWGASTNGQALVWPAAANAQNTRLGYTVTSAIYLPAAVANGTTIAITSGAASLYAGQPGGVSHYFVTSIGAGGSFVVSGLASDEVLSVQDSGTFTYTVTLPAAAPPPPPPPPPASGPTSTLVTWNCTGTPCPWGSSTSGQALVWPAAGNPTSARLGYTTSGAIYLPAQVANGTSITVNTGSATLYAGLPGADGHYYVTNIGAGGTYVVSGLAAGEVLSAQSSSTFSYQVTLGTAPPPPPPPPVDPPQGTGPASEVVTWTCTGTPCPWGPSTTGHALVWPAVSNPITHRLGYTVSKGVYLPAEVANGTFIWVDSGTANLYVGLPYASSHYLLATVNAGGYYEVQGVAPGEVLSVQGSARFEYGITLPDAAPIGDPGDLHSIAATWRCNLPGCNALDWGGAVINWPSWAAYSSNARSGDSSRTVYSGNGEVLYPYMGSWANGCEVTAKSGTVLIIEWQRGTDVWRETYLAAGDTHTIHLTSPENGAMIETYNAGPAFSVELHNCTPHTLP
jgi:hypothetical protein